MAPSKQSHVMEESWPTEEEERQSSSSSYLRKMKRIRYRPARSRWGVHRGEQIRSGTQPAEKIVAEQMESAFRLGRFQRKHHSNELKRFPLLHTVEGNKSK
ncbi:hypothetical protein Pmar_PMAR022754 [Perkinsus marinus ATCC 50983]|uniref:Uncharacterized protein n=1 Tax=Perkinsus marinus (strain ATCC 50983 / TXsc) TaxID=423536 RepID=C5LTH7_PERM5|nr:hypothetical protein Pmar_PMAR022754 [Perkinsus marinus ATCC 50983]EEQ99968.1 hypothetical protein Pmar_PMAR022754 [Perkinsus marinus ATCC 50983]|eukprot:XP_002767251.1 hypothetical protein Pmar_PMAR022754 [Perkinsus marinus ATCC 50983]